MDYGNSRFEVVLKNGRPFLRHWHKIFEWNGGYEDRTIYGVKTATPYIRWYFQKLELEPYMKEQLRSLLGN